MALSVRGLTQIFKSFLHSAEPVLPGSSDSMLVHSDTAYCSVVLLRSAQICVASGAMLQHKTPPVTMQVDGLRVTGVDPNPYMFDYAKESAQQAGLTADAFELKLGSAEAIPAPEASFDTVICTLVGPRSHALASYMAIYQGINYCSLQNESRCSLHESDNTAKQAMARIAWCSGLSA